MIFTMLRYNNCNNLEERKQNRQNYTKETIKSHSFHVKVKTLPKSIPTISKFNELLITYALNFHPVKYIYKFYRCLQLLHNMHPGGICCFCYQNFKNTF